GEDEDEEDVGPVPREAPQLHTGQGGHDAHQLAIRSGTTRANAPASTANPMRMASGTPRSPRPPPPEVIPSPRLKAATGFSSSNDPRAPVARNEKNAPPV